MELLDNTQYLSICSRKIMLRNAYSEVDWLLLIRRSLGGEVPKRDQGATANDAKFAKAGSGKGKGGEPESTRMNTNF